MSKRFLNSPRGRRFKTLLAHSCMTTRWWHLWQKYEFLHFLVSFVPSYLNSLFSAALMICLHSGFNTLHTLLRPSTFTFTTWFCPETNQKTAVCSSVFLSYRQTSPTFLPPVKLLMWVFTGRAAPAVFRLLPARSFIHIHAVTQKSSQLIEYLFQFSLIREENLLEKHPKFKVPLEVTVILPSRKTP